MISEGVEGDFELDVCVGQAPIQNLADVYTDLNGHLNIFISNNMQRITEINQNT